MVEHIRQSKIYGFLAAICLEFLSMFVHSAQDDDTPSEESVTALHEGQRTHIAPPPAGPMPIGTNYGHTETQNYPRFNADDGWFLGTPPALRASVT